jgi:quinol monooxygenase YgiN
MVTEIVRYHITSGEDVAFMDAYERAQTYLANSSHCLGYQLLRCSKDRGRFVLLIQWESARGHLEGFRRSSDFPPFYALVAPFFNEIDEMDHYEPTGIELRKPKGGEMAG